MNDLGMGNLSTATEITTTGLITMWVVPVLQWAKRSDSRWLRWINGQSAVAVSGAIAGLTALGLHVSFDRTTGEFALTGNVGMVIHALTQFTMQHVGHKGYVALQALVDITQKFDQFAAWQVAQTKAQNKALDIPTPPVPPAV